MALDEFVRTIGDDVMVSRMRHGAHNEQSGNECGNEQFNFHSVFFLILRFLKRPVIILHARPVTVSAY